MQSGQAEHLRQLIETSSILTPVEKADWLDMLILMNDKQAAELEQILKAQRTAAPQSSLASPSPAVPPLTHISNLPTGLNTVPRPSAPAPLSWNKQFKATMEEKELRAPPNARPSSINKPAPASPAIVRPVAPPPPLPSTRPTAYPAPTKRRSIPSQVHLETLADTGKLSVAAVRNMDSADLLIRLQQLSKMEGYFNLLSYLEDSSLYRSYLNTGQKILSGQLSFDAMDRNDTSLLTKEEFEAFTDILRKIQIN